MTEPPFESALQEALNVIAYARQIAETHQHGAQTWTTLLHALTIDIPEQLTKAEALIRLYPLQLNYQPGQRAEGAALVAAVQHLNRWTGLYPLPDPIKQVIDAARAWVEKTGGPRE